jgi:hypothetical protein
LGCSREVLSIISCINRLQPVVTKNENRRQPAVYGLLQLQLKSRLETLHQIPIINIDKESGLCDNTRIIRTAELYRIAALLYLHRSLLDTPRLSDTVQALVNLSLGIAKSLEVCTSPWPIFLTACEATNDEQRIVLLQVLERMQRVRGIGNVDVMKDMIETIWKRGDLYDNKRNGADIDWRDLFDISRRVPSFI